MICCLCGALYQPEERDKKFFQIADMQEIELKNIDHLHLQGKVLALCERCTKAAAFGRMELSNQTRYRYYRPQLRAEMFEEEQDQPKAS